MSESSLAERPQKVQPLRRFMDLGELSAEEVRALLQLARRLQREPEPEALKGKILGLLFFNPSLRTLASFQAAMARLGGASFVIHAGQGSWHLEREAGVVMNGTAAEHVREALPVLASYCDILGIRAFAAGRDLQEDLSEAHFKAMADCVAKPLINLESAMNHPCQALADWHTLDECAIPKHGKFVLSWAYHPRPLPLAVPAAVLQMAAMRGMHTVILRPQGFALPKLLMQRARFAAEASGGSLCESCDRDEALCDAEVVYAKEWGATACYGDAAGDAQLRRELAHWCVAESWFERASAQCRLMHCLPVRRNCAVAEELLEGPRSLVQEQAANRLVVQMAVLHRMLRGDFSPP